MTTQQATAEVSVAAGHTASGANSVTINSSVLYVMRLQHRLNHLGLRLDSAGNTLDLSGAMDSSTTSVLKVFQALTNPTGDAAPVDASGAISFHTAQWLNSAGAPRWTEYTPLGADPERYGTDWLGQIVDYGTTMVAGLSAEGVLVDSLSTIDGIGSASSHTAPVGRQHQVGLEVDFTVPAAAQTTGGDGLNLLSEQLLFSLVDAMHAKAEQLGLVMTQVALSNNDIATAINAVIPPPLGASQNVAVVGTGLAVGLMQVGFAAPALSSTVGANEANSMRVIVEKLRELGQKIETIADRALTAAAGTEIPYVSDGLADVIDLGQTFQDLAGDLNAAFALAKPDPINRPLDHLGDDWFALVDDGGTPSNTADDKLVIAARDPQITAVTLAGLSAAETAAIKLTNQTALKTSMEATAKLGFEGASGIAQPKFETVPELMAVLASELGVAESVLDWDRFWSSRVTFFQFAWRGRETSPQRQGTGNLFGQREWGFATSRVQRLLQVLSGLRRRGGGEAI